MPAGAQAKAGAQKWFKRLFNKNTGLCLTRKRKYRGRRVPSARKLKPEVKIYRKMDISFGSKLG